MCRVFQVSRSGYYHSVNRKDSQRELENQELRTNILESSLTLLDYRHRSVGQKDRWIVHEQIMEAHRTVKAAFKMTIQNQLVNPVVLIFHSDRGVQYACEEFRKLLKAYRINPKQLNLFSRFLMLIHFLFFMD